MNRNKAFWSSFMVSMVFVLIGFGVLYAVMAMDSSETDTPQQGIPMTVSGVEDSKTLMVAVGDEYKYFFIFKFNALQNKIGMVTISPSYIYSNGNSLADSMKKAGIMQCILDTEQEFDINIDYYLQCSWQQMSRIVGGLEEFGIEELGDSLPVTIKNFLLKGAEKLDGKSLINAVQKAEGFLDNELGLAFLSESGWCMIKYNLENLSSISGTEVKNNYARLVSNLNTNRIKRLDRIIGLLSASHVEYPRQVIVKGDNQAKEKIEEIMG